MSKTKIQWTAGDDGTPGEAWNPITGCTRVSAGCDHCYAFQLHDQRHVAWKRGRWDNAPMQYHKPFSQVQLLGERLDDPLHWRKPRRVFVNSMSDLFHPDVPDEYIARVFEVMCHASRHTFQVLTKRPERMRDWTRNYYSRCVAGGPAPKPWRNIWLGVSVENQAAADERIPLLLQTPAAGRFLSCEPLLGPISRLYRMPGYLYTADFRSSDDAFTRGIDWVIVGGESGPHARRMDPAWALDLVEQCRAAGVAVFVKQVGSRLAQECGLRDRHGGDMAEWPERALRIREYPAAAVREAMLT